jgi:crotonobetainyl-CoA:carnitine CoA-transferase CaiB-like acyl-CoA transferase
MNKKPLEGVRIIDASSILMVPYCTRLLSRYGSEIIKVETLRWR